MKQKISEKSHFHVNTNTSLNWQASQEDQEAVLEQQKPKFWKINSYAGSFLNNCEDKK